MTTQVTDKCPFCGKIITINWRMVAGMRLVMEHEGVKCYEACCPECGESWHIPKIAPVKVDLKKQFDEAKNEFFGSVSTVIQRAKDKFEGKTGCVITGIDVELIWHKHGDAVDKSMITGIAISTNMDKP